MTNQTTKGVTVYNAEDAAILTAALELAKAEADVDTDAAAIVEVAELYLAVRDNDSVANGLQAARDREDVDTDTEAMAALARAYTGV